MGLDREDHIRIARYLAGEISPVERSAFEAWCAENPAVATSLTEMRVIWENSGVRVRDSIIDTETEWSQLQQVMHNSDDTKVLLNPGRALWLKVAAAVLIALVAAVWLFSDRSPDGNANFIAATDSVKTFFLPDSSRIWLNSGSTLAFESDFGQSYRRVRLQGEGYFKVRPDQSRPFIIETVKATVQVLGTSFNVAEDDSTVVLVVEEGLVRFSPQDSSRAKAILVTAGETAVARNDNELRKEKLRSEVYGVWRKKNNPVYEKEKSLPANFIRPRFDWRKNTINQSVIQGQLENSAELASYRDIVLRVTYMNAKGRAMESEIQISGPVRPGAVVDFEKRLFDIFRDTKNMKISVQSARVEE